MTVQMIAEMTGYSAKTIRTWTAFGHIRWFHNGSRNYASKELVLTDMMSEDFRSIAAFHHLSFIRSEREMEV